MFPAIRQARTGSRQAYIECTLEREDQSLAAEQIVGCPAEGHGLRSEPVEEATGVVDRLQPALDGQARRRGQLELREDCRVQGGNPALYLSHRDPLIQITFRRCANSANSAKTPGSLIFGRYRYK